MTRPILRSSTHDLAISIWGRLGSVLVVLATLSACSLFTPSIPGQVDTGNDYERRVYAGVAGASTRLQPITDGSAYELDESTSAGVAVTLGMDLATRLALEMTAADLGAASLAPIATAGPGVTPQQLSYSTVAGSLLYYVVGDHVRANKRKGLAGYARLGLSQTDSTADIQLDEQDAMQMFVGLGAEYMMGGSTGLRAELVGYDGDATAAQLGLVYRFGRGKPRMHGPIVERTVDPSPRPMPEPELEPTIEQTAQTAEPDVEIPQVGITEAKTPEISAPIVTAREEAIADPEKTTAQVDNPETDKPLADTPIGSDETIIADNKSAEKLIEPTANTEAMLDSSPRPESQASEKESSAVEHQVAMVTPPVADVTPPAQKVVPPVQQPTVQETLETVQKKPIVDAAPVQPVATLNLEGVLRGVDFDSGTATLTPTGHRVLARYAALLKQSPGTRVEIQTHTDDALDAATSMQLTRLRAVSIARSLIGAGVKKRQLAARAFGSNVPRADNQSADGRRLNNRVEFKQL